MPAASVALVGGSSSPVPAAVSALPSLPDTEVDQRVPVELPAEQQPWFRRPDSPVRPVVSKIMVMRAAGHKDAAIAKRLNLRTSTIAQYVYIARKNGWLDQDDEVVDLEAELAIAIDRKIVRNLSASLDGRMTNWQTHETTLAAAKGRGVFKNHEASKGEATASVAMVAIQVIMPPVGVGDQVIDETQIGGVGAYADGDVIE